MENDDQPSSSDIVNEDDGCSLLLALDKSDKFFDTKKKLLERHGFKFDEHIYLKNSPSSEDLKAFLDELIPIARIIHLNESELYFEEDECPPVDTYSPRNELEALNFILSRVDISLSSCKPVQFNVLQKLREAVIDMIGGFGNKHRTEAMVVVEYSCVKENCLLKWGESHGARTSLQVAYVEDAGRGTIAKEDLDVGDTALEIPLSIIISEELVHESNMYPILSKIESISSETMLLIWSMKEKHIADSKFRIYFDTLPREFNTGLSFGVDAITTLEGTLLLDEIMLVKEHLWEQYTKLFPALCDNHPGVFPAEFYSWDEFKWACELWYSNSMKIMFADGSLRTCLVPIAGFLNHSLYPHITHYGKVDTVSNSLKFRLSRPCRAGEQCCLSYGNYSGSHLITYYGFLPEGENLNDFIPIDLESADGDTFTSEWSSHMLRGTWLSRSRSEIFHYGFPSPLLDVVRKARFPELYSKRMLQGSLENEMEVLNDLHPIFETMMEVINYEYDERSSTEWDIKLAIKYKDLQRRIISSALTSCNDGRKLLEIELLKCMQEDTRG